MQKIGKEVKIGLAVIGVLLTTFGDVLVKRLTRPSEANAATVADWAQPGDNARSSAGASDRPTMLDGSALRRPAIVPVAARSSGDGDGSSRRHLGERPPAIRQPVRAIRSCRPVPLPARPTITPQIQHATTTWLPPVMVRQAMLRVPLELHLRRPAMGRQ